MDGCTWLSEKEGTMYNKEMKHEQVNDPEYEHRLIQAISELKEVMREVKAYAG